MQRTNLRAPERYARADLPDKVRVVCVLESTRDTAARTPLPAGIEHAGQRFVRATVPGRDSGDMLAAANAAHVARALEALLREAYTVADSAIADRKMQMAQELDWEYAIERWWTAADAKVLVSVPGDGAFAYPISFDVTRTGYNDGAPHNRGIYDQVVTVWDPFSADPNRPGRANMTNWFDDSNAQTVAHEFGHMLGAFDEYWGGGINTGTWVTDYADLMGSSNPLTSPQGMKPLYYEPFKLWLASDDPVKTDVYGLLVPEPNALLLLLIGAAALRCTRRPNCGHNRNQSLDRIADRTQSSGESPANSAEPIMPWPAM